MSISVDRWLVVAVLSVRLSSAATEALRIDHSAVHLRELARRYLREVDGDRLPIAHWRGWLSRVEAQVGRDVGTRIGQLVAMLSPRSTRDSFLWSTLLSTAANPVARMGSQEARIDSALATFAARLEPPPVLAPRARTDPLFQSIDGRLNGTLDAVVVELTRSSLFWTAWPDIERLADHLGPSELLKWARRRARGLGIDAGMIHMPVTPASDNSG